MNPGDGPTQDRLRILHVVDSLERGGLERVVTDLAIAQHAAGHEVRVFSINDTQGFLPDLRAAAVPVSIGGKRKAFDLRVLRDLRKTARAVDIVHSHNFTPNYYSAAALLCARNAPVLVTTCHDMGTRLSNARLRLFYRFSLLRTRLAAMVSEQVRDRYLELGVLGGMRTRVIMNGIPIHRFGRRAERRAEARSELGIDPATTVIGCVGRLVPIKNHRALLDAMPALLAANAAIELLLVGGGELDGALRARAAALGVATKVRFLGERTDVASLLPAFDIFALPSLSEGLSIALLEACASGLAVVATDVGGNPQIVSHGVNGLLVPANDADALRAVLHDLVADPVRRASLGDAAARWIDENASMRTMHTRYERFYHDALDRTREQHGSDAGTTSQA